MKRSKQKGVSWETRTKSWKVAMNDENGKFRTYGRFKTEEEAIEKVREILLSKTRFLNSKEIEDRFPSSVYWDGRDRNGEAMYILENIKPWAS